MARPALEVAGVFRDHGPGWREANRGHVSLDQLKVMSAEVQGNRDHAHAGFGRLSGAAAAELEK